MVGLREAAGLRIESRDYRIMVIGDYSGFLLFSSSIFLSVFLSIILLLSFLVVFWVLIMLVIGGDLIVLLLTSSSTIGEACTSL